MGSAMAASLMPSTGLVSAPVRVPAYSKCQVVVVPLAMGAGEGEADGGVGGEAFGVEGVLSVASVTLGDVEAVVELEGGGGEVFERGEGDVGGGGEAGWRRGRGRR